MSLDTRQLRARAIDTGPEPFTQGPSCYRVLRAPPVVTNANLDILGQMQVKHHEVELGLWSDVTVRGGMMVGQSTLRPTCDVCGVPGRAVMGEV